MNHYVLILQEYAKAVTRARNMAEARESKMESLLGIMQQANLYALDFKGTPLMVQIRNLTIRLTRHIR